MLVRPYDYIVGRLNGKFLQSDPSLYRRSQGVRRMYLTIYRHHGDNKRTGFGTVPRSIVHEREYGNVSQQPAKSNDVKRRFTFNSDPRLQLLTNQTTLNLLILWKSRREEC